MLALTAALLLAIVGLAGCSEGEDAPAIETVKAAVLTGASNADFAQRLAGPYGEVSWRIGAARDGDEGRQAVEAVIEAVNRQGVTREVVLRYLLTPADETVALDDVIVDGEPRGLAGGALQMLLLQAQ